MLYQQYLHQRHCHEDIVINAIIHHIHGVMAVYKIPSLLYTYLACMAIQKLCRQDRCGSLSRISLGSMMLLRYFHFVNGGG